jgi:hypothetical protein
MRQEKEGWGTMRECIDGSVERLNQWLKSTLQRETRLPLGCGSAHPALNPEPRLDNFSDPYVTMRSQA